MQRRNIYLFLGFFVLLLVSGVGFLAINQREVSVDDVSVESEKKDEEKEVKEEAEGDEVEVEVVPTRPVATEFAPSWKEETKSYNEYLQKHATATVPSGTNNAGNFGYGITESKAVSAPEGWEPCEVKAYGFVFYIPPSGECDLLTIDSYQVYDLPGKRAEYWGVLDLGSEVIDGAKDKNNVLVSMFQTKDKRDKQTPIISSNTTHLKTHTGSRVIHQYISFAGNYAQNIEVLLDDHTTLLFTFTIDMEDSNAKYAFPKEFNDYLNVLVNSVEYEI
ncbi:MAG: hypothetical protein ACE5DX_03210 [Candidatus Dojkabacteria bacterium]